MLYTPAPPRTISVGELQRKYEIISDEILDDGPIMVHHPGNKDMVLLSQDFYSNLRHKAIQWEWQQVHIALGNYYRQKKSKKLHTLTSFAKLIKEPHAH